MKSIEALKHEADQSRLYRAYNNQCECLQWHVTDMTTRIPGFNWAECSKFIHGYPQKAPYEMELKHMIHWGKADARIIEKAFGVTLPVCVHEFYTEIQECVLNWKHTYHLLRPEHVVEEEMYLREVCEDEKLPVHLIRFCKVGGLADAIALRRHTQTGEWNIQYVPGTQPISEIQSAEYDMENLADNLDDWLIRLIQNDGIIEPNDRQDKEMVRIA